ncbi:MAG: sigma-70 family RNA polymerase sigma factor [Thermoguttaceae bacterium]|nr:sigma-70 family RNA polymerase sigma factor [Thermoguttaceae bacterium]
MSHKKQDFNNNFNQKSSRLFELARKGNFPAYAQFFEMNIDFILSPYRKDPRMDYHDLRQNVYFVTHSRVWKIKSVKSWMSYCRQCAKWLLADSIKKRKPKLFIDQNNIQIENIEYRHRQSSPDFNLLNQEIMWEVLGEVKRLNNIDQYIFLLHFMGDFTIKEVAIKIKMPWSTVYYRINLIRKQLSTSKKLQSLH